MVDHHEDREIAPDHNGFVGFTHLRVYGIPTDLIAADPLRGVDRFWAHFRSEGFRHANLITNELCMAALSGMDISGASTLTDLGTLAPPIVAAKQAYIEGVASGFEHNARLLRAVPALRDLGLSSIYVTSAEQAVHRASDMPDDMCLHAATRLTSLATSIALDAPPARSWTTARVNDIRQRSQDLTLRNAEPPTISEGLGGDISDTQRHSPFVSPDAIDHPSPESPPEPDV